MKFILTCSFRLTIDPRPPERIRRPSLSSYSFETALNDLIIHLRDLIHRHKHDKILVQLFEDLCTLRGLSSIILDRSKRPRNTSVNEPDKSILNDGLERIEKISRTINVFIELNRMNISHLDSRSIIINSFNEFYQNFNVRNLSFPMRLNFGFFSQILRQNHHVNVSPVPTNPPIDVSPTTSSSTRHHSENNSRKRTHTLSPSSYRRTREAEAKEDNEKYSLFKAVNSH